ncbi:MAG: DUF1684 domain-containing protein [Bacteroidota bacterium]
MSKYLVWGIGLVIIAVTAYSLMTSGEDPEVYRERIQKERMEKDEFLRNSTGSPFKNKRFTGLKYFEPDLDYKVMAKVEKIESRDYMNVPTSDGKAERYLKFAYAIFDLKGQRLKMLLLKKMGMGSASIIFTAFADDTSADTTYGGGRYLDLELKNARQIELDFNKAYNPYCDYDPQFSCPLPPRENVLPIAIEAGEKTYNTD